jgi:hypothetical protein
VIGCHIHDIIVLNVHAPTEDKCDDTNYSFYEETEGVFDQFPKYHIKILLGDFNAKVGREDIFNTLRPTMVLIPSDLFCQEAGDGTNTIAKFKNSLHKN